MRHGIVLLALGFGTAAADSICAASACPTRNVITAGGTTTKNKGDSAAPTQTGTEPAVKPAFDWKYGDDIDTGDIRCQSWCSTPEIVDEETCYMLMRHMPQASSVYFKVDMFYELNPTLSEGCVGIRPNTDYCVNGYIEPLRAYDGRCGPPHYNATCCGTEMGPCCNSETWTCGESEKDCDFGVCYDGLCPGHTVFTTDGTCGYQNLHRRCAGKWGDCCRIDGKCGTGWDYCGNDRCQSGNCFPSVYDMRDCRAGRCYEYRHYFEEPAARMERLHPTPISVELVEDPNRPGYMRKTTEYADYSDIEWVPIPPTSPAISWQVNKPVDSEDTFY